MMAPIAAQAAPDDVAAPAWARLHRDVAALAALDRRTTTDGERRSAEWIAGRLQEIGAAEVRTETFRSQSSWSPAHLVHVIAAAAASLLPGRLGRAALAGVAASYELEVSGRNQWVRRLLPAGTGTSVTASIPSAGPRRRTLVLVAHHDAAQGGWVWHPLAVAANRRRSSRTGSAAPTHAPVLAAMALAAAPDRRVRIAARLALAAAGALFAQSRSSRTAPGANDNGSGVAAVLELARRLAGEPLPGTEVLLVFPGGEEVGNTGMRRWLREAGARLDRESTLLVNVDAVGSGGHLVVSRREGLTATYAAADVRLAQDVAAASGIELRSVVFPNVSDGFPARRAGLRSISLLSYDDGWVSNLHRPEDTPENVSWNTVEQAIALTGRIAERWSHDDV